MPIERISLNTTGTYPGTSGGALKDTVIQQGSPTTSYGTDTGANAGYGAAENQRRNMLFEFPLSAAVMAASAINSVTLRLNVSATAGGTPFGPFDFHELLVTFTENQVTWNERATGTNWATAGATGGADIGSVLATLDWTNASGWMAWTASGLATAINASKAGGVFRLLVKGSATEYNAGSQPIKVGAVHTRESTDGLRPVLEIDYTGAADTTAPTITTGILTGAAGQITAFSAAARRSI